MWNRFICLMVGFATLASAHFVWVVPQSSNKSAQVFISEELKPSDEVEASMVSGSKLSVRSADGHETALVLMKGASAFTVQLPGVGPRLIHGATDLGLTQRGSEKPYLLVYYPKTILGNAFDPKALVGDASPVEIVPVGHAGALRLKVLAHGKPLVKSEVTILLPDGTQKKSTTDAEGLTETLAQTGRFGAWARYWEPLAGERDGKSYSETRNYATLVFDILVGPPARAFATMPEAASTFGAVVSNGWLYVYGGHTAVTHTYSTAAVSGQFNRLNLATGKWEKLQAARVCRV